MNNDLNETDKKLQGTVIGHFSKDNTEYASKDEFVQELRQKIASVKSSQAKSAKSNQTGDDLEEKAAEHLGGELSKSGTQDVHWRAISRGEADGLKQQYNYSTDFELMKNFKRLTEAERGRIGGLKSTPVDVYGSDFLCLVGGGAKFDGETGELRDTARDRIKELEVVCNALGYRAILVFNEDTTTEDQKESVRRQFPGMQVELLKP